MAYVKITCETTRLVGPIANWASLYVWASKFPTTNAVDGSQLKHLSLFGVRVRRLVVNMPSQFFIPKEFKRNHSIPTNSITSDSSLDVTTDIKRPVDETA